MYLPYERLSLGNEWVPHSKGRDYFVATLLLSLENQG